MDFDENKTIERVQRENSTEEYPKNCVCFRLSWQQETNKTEKEEEKKKNNKMTPWQCALGVDNKKLLA